MTETESEVVIVVETTADVVGCWRCGVRAEARNRIPHRDRDLDEVGAN